MSDYLPAKFLDPQRDQLASDWRRDVGFRNPGANVGPGSQPWLDSYIATDAILPLYTYAQDSANAATWVNSSGPELDIWLQSFSTQRLPATGAVGFIQISTSSGGTVLQDNDQGTINGFTYRVIRGGSYSNGAQVAIIGVDVGPQTDQPAGSTFSFSAARPGCNPQATVVMRPDGTGLIGGSNIETDDQAKARLSQLKANPPGSGNDAHYQSIVANTPGVSVQQAFTYPAILGPGTTGVTFTLRPPQSGASRIPSEADLTIALGFLQGAGTGQMPASDSVFMCALLDSALDLILKVDWAAGAAGWADFSPFPLYQGPGENWQVTDVVVPTPTTFHILSTTDTTVPQPGQNIAVFDVVEQVFRRKKILSATSVSGGYTIVVDPTGGLSDLTFAPPVGQVVSPWSDSLDTLVAPVLAYLDSVGPGEQVPGPFFDAGLRQKRSPPSPSQWSSVIGNRMLGGPPNASQPFSQNAPATPTLLSTSSIGDVEVVEPTFPYATPVGFPGVAAYLLSLDALAAFPE